jgi:tetratricopeptide (TPR) repeat protein
LILRVETASGRFYETIAHYHRGNGDQVAALKFCQSGLALATSIGSSERQSSAFGHLAWIKITSGNFLGAKEDALKSQRAAKIAGNIYTEASALDAEATCWFLLGSYGRCLSLLQRATHHLDLCGMLGGSVHSAIINTQAEVHRCKSEYVEARNIQIQNLHDSSMDLSPYHHALALSNIAQIDVEIGGSEDDIQQNIGKAALLFHRFNYSIGLAWCDMYRAALDVQQGNFSTARSQFQKCLRHTWGNDPEGLMYCLEKLGAVEQWSPADRILFNWPVVFLVNSFKLKQRLQLHKALQFLGGVFQAQGDQESAINLLTVALDGFTQMDVHRSRAECMARLGDISKVNGDDFKAAKLWETARPLFERSSQQKQLTELNAKLAKLSHIQSQEVQQDT